MSKDDTGAPATVTVVAHDVGPVGGMERMLTELIGRLLVLGVEVTLISRTCGLPSHPGLRWVRVPGPPRPFALAYPWFFVVGTFITWRRRRGLVHTTGAIVLNRADLSTIHFCHYGARDRMPQRTSRRGLAYRANAWIAGFMSRLGERVCYRPHRTRCLVAVSAGLGTELREHFPATAESVRVIPNGVDRVQFEPSSEARARIRGALRLADDDLVVAFVGSEWEGKGLRVLVESLQKAEDWHLLVIGRGDEKRYRQIAERYAPGRVHFVGETREIAAYYSAMDAFALPSAYESFSMSAHEAAARGAPVLITHVSGAEDLLVDGETGWFIERDPELIGDRLVRLGLDPELRKTMGRAARAATEKMGWAKTADAYLALYAKLSG